MKNSILTLLTIAGLFGFVKQTGLTSNWIEIKDGQIVDSYSRIGNKIYCGEVACDVKPMQGIDIETFRIKPGSKFAKDKNHVYYPLEILCVDGINCGVCYCTKFIVENADPTTFDYLDRDYSIDNNSVFFRGELIESADVKTFRVIKGGKYFYFAVDSKFVYKHNQIFKEADPATFYYDSLNKLNNEWTYIIGDKINKWIFSPPYKITPLKK